MFSSTEIVTDAVADSNIRRRQRLPSQQERRNVTRLPGLTYNLDEFVNKLKIRLTVEDFRKFKLLSRSWVEKRKMRNVNNLGELIKALKLKLTHTDDVDSHIYCILMEILFTIQRYDLLKLGNHCKHSVHTLLRNGLSVKWLKWYNAIESLDPSDKDYVKDYLSRLLRNEETDTVQLDMLESLQDLFEKDLIKDVERDLLLSKPPYQMGASPCGICVIINNKTFNGQHERTGTDRDKEKLKKIWESFDFLVEIYNNHTAPEISKILFDLSRRDHNAYRCVVVCILSHGKEDVIVGIDGSALSISKDIVPLFYSNNNTSLNGKPKLFFIESCQGNTKMSGVREAAESNDPEDEPMIKKIISQLSLDGRELNTDGSIAKNECNVVTSFKTSFISGVVFKIDALDEDVVDDFDDDVVDDFDDDLLRPESMFNEADVVLDKNDEIRSDAALDEDDELLPQSMFKEADVVLDKNDEIRSDAALDEDDEFLPESDVVLDKNDEIRSDAALDDEDDFEDNEILTESALIVKGVFKVEALDMNTEIRSDDAELVDEDDLEDDEMRSDGPLYMEDAFEDPEIRSDAPLSDPDRADDFIFLATAEGFEAFRHMTEGSWFVESLVHYLDLLGDAKDLQEIATMVRDAVAKEEAKNKSGTKFFKQMPIIKSTLRKKLIFKRK